MHATTLIPLLLPLTLALPSTYTLATRDIVQPSLNAHAPTEQADMTPYTTPLPQGACGGADFFYSRAPAPYIEANSFFWLYPTDGRCQQIDMKAPGASSVNRVLVDIRAETWCGSCTFYTSDDCTTPPKTSSNVYGPQDSYAPTEGVGSDGYANNNFGYNSWMCTAGTGEKKCAGDRKWTGEKCEASV